MPALSREQDNASIKFIDYSCDENAKEPLHREVMAVLYPR
jgi:hypothetical protein